MIIAILGSGIPIYLYLLQENPGKGLCRHPEVLYHDLGVGNFKPKALDAAGVLKQ